MVPQWSRNCRARAYELKVGSASRYCYTDPTSKLTGILYRQRVARKLVHSLEIHQPRVIVILSGIEGFVEILRMNIGKFVIGSVPTTEAGV
jgi:hypothetical protein